MCIRDSDLWLQQQVREGLIEVSKVPGERNPADLMTKILPLADIRIRVADLGMEMVEDKAAGGSVDVKRVSFIGSVEVNELDVYNGDETQDSDYLSDFYHFAKIPQSWRCQIPPTGISPIKLESSVLGLGTRPVPLKMPCMAAVVPLLAEVQLARAEAPSPAPRAVSKQLANCLLYTSPSPRDRG